MFFLQNIKTFPFRESKKIIFHSKKFDKDFLIEEYNQNVVALFDRNFLLQIDFYNLGTQLQNEKGPAFDCGEISIISSTSKFRDAILDFSRSNSGAYYSHLCGAFLCDSEREINNKEFWTKKDFESSKRLFSQCSFDTII